MEYPDRLHNDEDEYRLLGVDEDGHGHYWLQDNLMHSIVYAVNHNQEVEEIGGWISNESVPRYIEQENLDEVSEFAESYLQTGGSR